jgi:hypothetical protein
MDSLIQNAAERIGEFLAIQLTAKGHFPARSFYGEAFSMLLWSACDGHFEEVTTHALKNHMAANREQLEFHWEFNNYALLHYRRRTGDRRVDRLLSPLRFKGTLCTNWTLLRSAARLAAGEQRLKALRQLIGKVRHYQLPSGQILDDDGVRSFQYHCFSAALLAEMSEYSLLCCLRRPFLRAVDFIRHFILPNGDTLYIGRGQEQSFGYGALLYCLAQAYRITGVVKYLRDLERVWCFVEQFQRDDGSFPLVLTEVEKGVNEVIDTQDPLRPGWYGYNNYFDYLPFLGTYLARTADVLAGRKAEQHTSESEAESDYQDDHYCVVRKNRYVAVLGVPGGCWTNDMPFPYVCLDGESVFPCYGGEQFMPSLYSREAIPLPWVMVKCCKRYFRDELTYRIQGSEMIGEGSLGRHVRGFVFREDGFTTEDVITLWNGAEVDALCAVNYLFFRAQGESGMQFDVSWRGRIMRLETSVPCTVVQDPHYCAMGSLQAVRHMTAGPLLAKEWRSRVSIKW